VSGLWENVDLIVNGGCTVIPSFQLSQNLILLFLFTLFYSPQCWELSPKPPRVGLVSTTELHVSLHITLFKLFFWIKFLLACVRDLFLFDMGKQRILTERFVFIN
jgi:hypothetical protein